MIVERVLRHRKADKIATLKLGLNLSQKRTFLRHVSYLPKRIGTSSHYRKEVRRAAILLTVVVAMLLAAEMAVA